MRRRGKTHDGWKPFLKGFLAARCGAVVVAMRDDDDAAQYLGDDYPFYVRGPTRRSLEYDMAGIAAAFGGPDWHRAQAIMAQVARPQQRRTGLRRVQGDDRRADELTEGMFRARNIPPVRAGARGAPQS